MLGSLKCTIVALLRERLAGPGLGETWLPSPVGAVPGKAWLTAPAGPGAGLAASPCWAWLEWGLAASPCSAWLVWGLAASPARLCWNGLLGRGCHPLRTRSVGHQIYHPPSLFYAGVSRRLSAKEIPLLINYGLVSKGLF